MSPTFAQKTVALISKGLFLEWASDRPLNFLSQQLIKLGLQVLNLKELNLGL